MEKKVKYMFIIVGAGGTGSLLARDLPKLLIDTNHKMLLIDGDIVEKKNLKRQSYQEQDIKENKAVALSSKINSFYDVNCEALPKYLTGNEIIEYVRNTDTSAKLNILNTYEDYIEITPVIIGCVDNNVTRKILERNYKELIKERNCYYLDSGNGEYEGNIYIKFKNEFGEQGALRSEVYQYSEDLHPLEESCEAQASQGNVQYLVTNNKMANYLLEHLHALLTDELKGGIQNVERFGSVFY